MINIEVDSIKKAIKVIASGTLKADEVQDYLNKLEEKIKRIDPKQYCLIMDAREQKAVTPDAIPLLEKALKYYTTVPFAKRFSIVLDSVIAMQQVKRVGKSEVDQFIMVKSLEEAYKNM